MSKVIMGISLEQRQETAKEVQDVLTKHGCIIKTRLGVHQASDEFCSERGLIIIEFLENANEEIKKMELDLQKLQGVVVKKMEF